MTAPEQQAIPSRNDRRIALLIFVCFACIYGLTNRGTVRSMDAAMRLGIAEYLVEHGSAGYSEEATAALHEHFGGQMMWGLGHPITIVPAVLTGRLAEIVIGAESGPGADRIPRLVREGGAAFTNALTGALACAVLFLTCVTLRYSRRASILAALALGLGTVWWPYTQDARYEILMGLCTLLSLYFVLRYARGGGVKYAALSGAIIGFAYITRLSNLILIPVVCCLWFIERRREHDDRPLWRPVLAFGVSLAVFVAIQAWADWTWTGELFPNQLAKYPHYKDGFHGGVISGSIRLLLDKRWGALWYSPLCLVALAWLPALIRRHPGMGVALLATLALTLVAVAPHVPGMGVVWGPRHLIPTFAALAILFAPWAEEIIGGRRRGLRIASIAILGLAAALQFMATTVHVHRYHSFYTALDGAEKSRFPNNFPLVHRPLEMAEIITGMAAGAPWKMQAVDNDLSTEEWSQSNARSLNVFNYWWSLAYYERIPWPLLMLGALLLIAGAGLALTRAWRLSRELDEPPGLSAS